LTCLQNAPKLSRSFDEIRARGAVVGVAELEARKPLGGPVQFGEFRLDPARAEFTRAGEPVALRPKTYALLTLFVASPGRVLAKDELLAALWPKAVVAEGSLSQCINELRAALGARGESLIRTVARQGYRFDAEVLAEQAASAPAWDKPSVAVLPFQNLSGDPEQDYFADGMVEELITALSRMRSLVVIAARSSFTYKGRVVDVKQVGRGLGARYMLEGSVRRAGNRLRIAGRYDDASSHASIVMRGLPNSQTALRIHAASSAFAGRLAEARQSVARLRALNPMLRVSNLRDVLGPYRRPEDVAKYEEGLRRAGLPE
jgi:TolB-like protein